jgi:hypothetical protein
MAIGRSGRIVIEVDPERKARIHAALKARGLTLREWFLLKAETELLGLSVQSAAMMPNRGKVNG